jgi:hypothetical protein
LPTSPLTLALVNPVVLHAAGPPLACLPPPATPPAFTAADTLLLPGGPGWPETPVALRAPLGTRLVHPQRIAQPDQASQTASAK